MKKIIYIFIGLVIGLIIGLFVFRPQLPVGMSEYNRFEDATNSSVDVGTTTATTVLLAKGGRMYAKIMNDDSSNDVYCFLGNSAVKNKGILLKAAGGSYEITPDNLYVGLISCISTSAGASSTILTIEK